MKSILLKKSFSILITIFFFIFLVAIFVSAEQEIILEVSSSNKVDHPAHHGLELADKILQEKTNGRIKLKIYPDSTYGAQADYRRAVRMGTLDICNYPPDMDFYPPGGALQGPYMFQDYKHWAKFKDSEFYTELLEKSGEEMGVKYLGLFQFGFRQTTTGNVPAKTPDDFKGLKLRVVNRPPYSEVAEILNATGTPLAITEVYMALKTGVIDAQENPFSNIIAFSFYEVQKYLILTGHMLATDGYVISLNRWNSLSEEDQNIIKEAFEKCVDLTDEEIILQEEQYLQRLKEEGMIVIEPELELFRERAKKVYDKYPEWTDFYERVQALLD